MAKGLGWATFLAAWCVASLLALEVAPAAFAQSGTNPPETSNFEQSGSTAAPAPETSGGKGTAGPAQHPAKSANSPNFRQSGAPPAQQERQQKKSTGLGGPAAPPGAEGSSNYRQSGNPEGK